MSPSPQVLKSPHDLRVGATGIAVGLGPLAFALDCCSYIGCAESGRVAAGHKATKAREDLHRR
jgi:hypothetical protein